MNLSQFSPVVPAVLTGSADERAEAIAIRCGSGRLRHGTWIVCCPAHDDTRPSLYITPTADKVLIICFAGCTPEAILAAVGLGMRDLYADDLPPVSLPKKRQKHSRISEPPGPVTAHTIALHWLIQFLVDDITILEIEAARACLRQAAAHPLQWLWVEQQLQRHGLSLTLVWQVIFPSTQYPSPQPSTSVPILATRVPNRVSSTMRVNL